MDLLSLSLSLSIAISEMDLRSCSIFNREGDDLCHGMESRPNFEKQRAKKGKLYDSMSLLLPFGFEGPTKSTHEPCHFLYFF